MRASGSSSVLLRSATAAMSGSSTASHNVLRAATSSSNSLCGCQQNPTWVVARSPLARSFSTSWQRNESLPPSPPPTLPPQGVMINSSHATYLRASTGSHLSDSCESPATSSEPLPSSAPPRVFTVAPSYPITHGVHVATLTLSAYGPERSSLEFFTNFARHVAYALCIPTTLPARLPTVTRLWTVPKSPFVHKSSQENFTRSTHKRVIKIYDSPIEVVQERWARFLRMNAMNDVRMKLQLVEWHSRGVGSRLDELEKKSESEQKKLEAVKVKKADDGKASKQQQASSTKTTSSSSSAEADETTTTTLAQAAERLGSVKAQIEAIAEELLRSHPALQQQGEEGDQRQPQKGKHSTLD